MLLKSICSFTLVVGLFAVSAYSQQTNPKPPKNPDQVQNRTEKRGGGAQKGNGKFDQLDLDHDGYITRSEWTRNQKAFSRMDENGDGQVSRLEFDMFRRQRNNSAGTNPKN